jgi:hypothetical protein
VATILDVLQQIRQRPGVILGCPSANNLYYFLTGFTWARGEAAAGDYDFLAGFNQWVHDRYHITSTQGWAKIIEFYSVTPVDQMELFWKLLDQYLAHRESAQRKVS